MDTQSNSVYLDSNIGFSELLQRELDHCDININGTRPFDIQVNVEQAQINKMGLIFRNLRLTVGMNVLDIGCGWGGFARYAIEHYSIRLVGLTISKEQQRWVSKHYQTEGLEVRCQDYRDIHGTFDRIVSIGMFEHVDYKKNTTFFKKCHDVLSDQGLMLLHTIGGNTSQRNTDPWLDRYIFPNGVLPSIAQIGRAVEPFFIMEDWHNFGADYDWTLMAWHRRTESAWRQLGERYDERFRRMWAFYLLACAGAFRSRHIQLWQLVLSKEGIHSGYQRPTLAD